MNYKLGNRNIKIPDTELESIQKGLSVSQAEAIQIYLEDNGYMDNAEQVALDKKAKENKVTATIHQAKKSGERKKAVRERKRDMDKEYVITTIAQIFRNDYKEMKNVQVINISKIIEFDFNGNHYKIDLIKTRNKKE